MKVGDLVRLNNIGCYHPDDEYLSYGVVLEVERDRYDIGCFHPDDEYLAFGVLLEIEKDRYDVGDGPILRGEGCHIRWDNGTTTVEPIQFIKRVPADVVK